MVHLDPSSIPPAPFLHKWRKGVTFYVSGESVGYFSQLGDFLLVGVVFNTYGVGGLLFLTAGFAGGYSS